jgi:hypothetical protein
MAGRTHVVRAGEQSGFGGFTGNLAFISGKTFTKAGKG